MVFFFNCKGKISFRHKIPTASVRKQSARLKTGKLPMLIKSLTPAKNTLSTRFPSVPARKRRKTRFPNFFCLHNQKKSPIPTNEIKITKGR